MKKSVSSAAHPAMALVATARPKSTDMAAETISAFIVGQLPTLAHVATALTESTKSSRAECAPGPVATIMGTCASEGRSMGVG